MPAFRSQQGLLGHVLGGWAVAGTYFITSGQPYTPIQFAVNGGGPLYDNAFTAAFGLGGTDQFLRPFLGNPGAPANTVGIFAADGCQVDSSGNLCGNPAIAPNTLVSFNGINQGLTGVKADPNNPNQLIPDPAHPATVVTAQNVRFIANTATATKVFNSPFGNVARNSLRDARTNTGNFSLYKDFKVKERLNVTFHRP